MENKNPGDNNLPPESVESSKNNNSIVEKRATQKYICYTHPVVFSILTQEGGEKFGYFNILHSFCRSRYRKLLYLQMAGQK